MTRTAEEGEAYLGEETREKTRGMASSTDTGIPSVAGVKVLYTRYNVIHCAL